MADLKELWNRGYSVDELWGHTSPPVSKPASLTDGKDTPDWGMLSAIEHYQGYGEGEAYALQQLETGNWIAIGFRAPREFNSPLTVIPKEVIPGLKLYGDSSIAGSGLSFVGIRIVHNSLLNDAAKPSIEPRKAGRPTMELQIKSAIKALLAEGRFEQSAKTATHFDLIREKIAELFPDESSRLPTDKTLYKWIPKLLSTMQGSD